MALNAGDYVMVRYRGVPGLAVYHVRLLLAVRPGTADVYGLTPDHDHYEESYTVGLDFLSVQALAHAQEIPPGVPAAQVY